VPTISLAIARATKLASRKRRDCAEVLAAALVLRIADDGAAIPLADGSWRAARP
jgi:hypothetical protein